MRNVLMAATGAIALLSSAAQAMPHGRPGLWNITTSMKMANMPQIPPEALAMMKQRGMKIPGMNGEPIVNQICMTPQDVNEGAAAMQRMREQHDIKCTPRILSESASSVSSEVTCHGLMEGVGRTNVSWRGDSQFEGDYSFKGLMHGQPTESSSHFRGEFVKADCGSVKPFRAKDMPGR